MSRESKSCHLFWLCHTWRRPSTSSPCSRCRGSGPLSPRSACSGSSLRTWGILHCWRTAKPELGREACILGSLPFLQQSCPTKTLGHSHRCSWPSPQIRQSYSTLGCQSPQSLLLSPQTRQLCSVSGCRNPLLQSLLQTWERQGQQEQ